MTNHHATHHIGATDGRRTNESVRPVGAEYWRVTRVARYLDVSTKRVYQLVQERRLEAIRLGPRQMRITRRSIDDYLEQLHAAAAEEMGD